IRIDEDQVRQRDKGPDDEDTKQLAESIGQQGLDHPVVVRWMESDDIYEIVAGERRFIAMSKILGWTEIPIRIKNVRDQDLPWVQLHENVHRKALHPLDLADAIDRATEAGLTTEEVATKLCKSATFVHKALTITKLTPEARAFLERSPIKSFEVIYEVAQLPAERQLPVLQSIVAEDLTRDEIRRLAADTKQLTVDPHPKRGRPAKVRPYAKTITTEKGARVTVHFRKSRATTQEVAEALEDALKALTAKAAKAA
ncbi:MAG: ParB/RepB/Spo0J family partition protein, partial [Planctomycetes bacterium]|nr:ParB/RepB/Spo0J family partition protein [Planctomycetota bacterium]